MQCLHDGLLPHCQHADARRCRSHRRRTGACGRSNRRCGGVALPARRGAVDLGTDRGDAEDASPGSSAEASDGRERSPLRWLALEREGRAVIWHRVGLAHSTVLVTVLIVMATQAGFSMAQTAISNAGLEGGQDGLFDAILATPNQKTPVPQDNIFATAPGAEQAARTPQFTLNVLAPALFNSNAQFLSSGGSKTLEGSPLVRLGWASQLFDTPIRVSGGASLETERFVNAPGAAIDYIRPNARAQYINPENDQDYSPFLSYVPRLDFDPTFANNFATRQDLNLGIDKVFNFDGGFNRIPVSSNSSSETVWSFGFSVAGQRRFRDPAPQSYSFFFNPSAAYIISEQ